MPFLSVCGVTLDVLDGTFEERPRDIGETDEAFDGTPKVSRQRMVRDVSFEAGPYVQADAYAWDQFLRGAGERWSFDASLYGSKGSGPSSSTGLSIQSSGAGPKHGANYLYASAGNNFTAAGVCSGTTATVLLWRYYSAAWHHYVIWGNASAVYLDGSSSGASISAWYSLSGGQLAIGNDQSFDDLVVLPFTAPTSWASALYTWHNASAWPALPLLTVAGDAIPEGTSRSVLGGVERHRLVQAVLGGSLVSNGRILSASLKGA